MDQIKIGSFLKQLRKEKGITQEQLAEALNVSNRTVSRWETGNNMPDIGILVDIADYYNISIPEIINGERKSEIMNKEEREIAKSMSDYATTEKENIFKEMKVQSIIGVYALILYLILHETGAYMYNDILAKLTDYCEILVFVTVFLMATFTTGSLSRLRSKSRKVVALECLPKTIRFIVIAVIDFCGAAFLRLALVQIFAL